MKKVAIVLCAFLLSACGKPSGISDADYAAYKELGAPKILFSCTTRASSEDPRSIKLQEKLKADMAACGTDFGCLGKVAKDSAAAIDNWPKDVNFGYRAGVGIAATYNKILGDAKKDCGGELSILEKSQ